MSLILDDWQKEILNTKGSIILCSGRQVGKSTIISYRDGERAAKNHNESILIVSKTERQAELLFIKVLLYIEENYKHLICSGRDRPTKHELKLKNGSIIRCLPTGQAGEGIRGFTLTKITFDEAPLIEEEVFLAVIPSLLTKGTDMDLLGTPHGAKGFFYECYKNENKLFKVFHVNSEQVINNRLISRSWSQQDRENALRHLENAKQIMSSREFMQEYMGIFIKEFALFFPEELIKKCCVLKRRGINKEFKHYLGVDIARMGGDLITYEIIRKINKNNFEQVENIFMDRKLTTETENKIIELAGIYPFGAESIGLDAGAGTLGVSVLDHLLDNSATRRKVIALNSRARALDRDETRKTKIFNEDMYNNLLNLMERGEIKLLDDDEIIASLKSVQYEYIIKEGMPTKLRIFGNYTHIAEGLIRAAWLAAKDKHLNIWVR